MVQWPPRAVATVEVLIKLILILCDELETRDKRLAELEEKVTELKRKLNINSGKSGLSPSQDPLIPRGKGGKEKAKDDSGMPKPNQCGDRPDKPRAEVKGENSKPIGKSSQNASREGKKDKRAIVRNSARSRKDLREIFPKRCFCGCEEFGDLRSFYTHQHCELPYILLHVIHFNLYKGRRANCGKEGRPPAENSTCYGPNFTAFVGSASAFLGCTRRSLLDFLTKPDFFRTEEGESIPLSLGGLDRLIDRCSRALKRHREKIGEVAREAPINYVDETSWPMFGSLGAIKYWLGLWLRLWSISSISTDTRCRETFYELIGDWVGILISDDYTLYRSWPKREEAELSCPSSSNCPKTQGSPRPKHSPRRRKALQRDSPPHPNESRKPDQRCVAGLPHDNTTSTQGVFKAERCTRHSNVTH